VAAQRDAFSNLSTNMVAFIKVTKASTPVYLQHCPMANDGKGADWLSKENVVKNPYYGSMMLGCGKVTETIK
jgi:predicted SnoaL-like aldol condensation-catalyzing enzyme